MQDEARMFARWIGWFVLVGFLIRLAYLLWLQYSGSFMIGDAIVYHMEGNSLANGNGWINVIVYKRFGIIRQTAGHPPLYSYWLALWSFFGMRSTLSHQIASAFLGSSSIAVVGYVARKIRGNTVGLIAAAIAVLHPSFWSWDGMILSETLAILASASLLLFFVSSTEFKSNRWYMLGGVLAGIAILSRAELLMAIVLLTLGVLILQRSRTAIKHAAIMAGVAIIVLTPWAAYNTARFDRFVPLSNSAGVTLAASNCADVAGQYAGRWSYFCAVEAAERVTKKWAIEHPQEIPNTSISPNWQTDFPNAKISDKVPTVHQYLKMNEAVVDGLLRQDTVEWIKQHPRYFIKSVAIRIGRVTGLYKPTNQMRSDVIPEGRRKPVAFAAWYLYFALLPFVVFGFYKIFRESKQAFLTLIAPLATSLFVVATTFGNTRYRAIAEPTLAITAAVGLFYFGQAVIRRWHAQRQYASKSSNSNESSLMSSDA